jgi:spore coat protein CotH
MKKLTIITLTLVLFLIIYPLFGGNSRETASTESRGYNSFINGYVADIHIVMKDSDWQGLQADPLSKQYVRANFMCNGQLYENVAVRTKGENSLEHSAENGRLPLKIDLNFFNVAQEFQGIKKLSLNNCYKDPSFMREILGYRLFERMGIPTPKNAFAYVRVNDTNLGLYTMVEQVEKTFLRREFADSSGDLYKPQGLAGLLNWTKDNLSNNNKKTDPKATSENIKKINSNINVGGTRLGELVDVLQREGFNGSQKLMPSSPNNQAEISEINTSVANVDFLEQMAIKTNENNTNHKALYHFLEILNKSPDDSFPEKIEKVVNVDEVLRFLAVSVFIVHTDNYIGSGENYYLFEEKGKFSIIPWDLNESFGGYNMGLAGNVADFDIDSIAKNPDKPLTYRLLAHKPYLDKYHQYIRELLDGPFANNAIETVIDEIAYYIKPYVQTDELKFFSLSEFEKSINLASDKQDSVTEIDGPVQEYSDKKTKKITSETSESQVPLLKEFIKQRCLSVRRQLDG